MWILVCLLILILSPVDTGSFRFFSCRECTVHVSGVSSFHEFFIWVGYSPQIQQSLQLQEMLLSFSLCPKAWCSVTGTAPLLAWLPVWDTVCLAIASQCISAVHQQGALRWRAEPASPRRFTVSYSGLYSHFCEYTGIFLVYSTNKIILSLILTVPVLQPARRGHSW